MHSVLQGSILKSQGSSLGIIFKVHVFRESQRGHYKKARIDPSKIEGIAESMIVLNAHHPIDF